MKLIIDTNILIAALLRDSTIRHLLFYADAELITGEFLEPEVIKYKEYIKKKANINDIEFSIIFEKIKGKLIIIKDELIAKKMDEAIVIIEPIDINDAPVLALALAIENNGIWTEDKHFEKQNRIKIWKTKEVIRFFDNESE